MKSQPQNPKFRINPENFHPCFQTIKFGSVQNGSLFIFRGHTLKFPEDFVFLFLKIYIIIANSADPDEMPPYAAFHLGLHCLP